MANARILTNPATKTLGECPNSRESGYKNTGRIPEFSRIRLQKFGKAQSPKSDCISRIASGNAIATVLR